eukprot:Anaeramoba_ignava/c21744_g1_i1.p1 GENE.c21744_g1_i1~~c21744_g1_i1.p1  ORF type:complete len:1799 (-),score=579.42 c21744_g1_i1:765-5756(-)
MKGGILGSNEGQILQIISEFIAKSDFEDEEEDLVQKMITDLLNLGNEQSLTNQKQEDLQNEQIHEIGMDIEIPLLDEKPKSTFHSKVIELIQNQIAQASLSSSVTFKFLVSIIVKNTSFFYDLNEKAIVLMIHHFQCGMSDLNLGIDILSFVVDWFGDLKKKSEPTFSQLQKLRLQEEIFSILIAFSHLLSVSSGVFSRIKNIFKRCCLIFDNLNISFSGNLTQPTRILSLIKVPIKYNNWSFKFVHEQNLDKLIQTILLNSDLVDKEIIQNVIFIFTSFIQNKESFDGDALQFIDDLTNEINNVLAKLDLMKFKFAIIAEYFLFLYQQIPHLFAKHALKFYHFLKQAQVIHDFESHHEIEMKNQSNFHQAQNIIISETINNQQPQNSMQNYPNQIIENNQLMNQNSVLATNSILLQNLEIIIHTILLLKPEPSKLFEIMIDLVESAKSPAFLSVLLDQCFAILDSNTDPILFLKEITHKNDPKSNTSQMKIETKKEKVDEDPSNELIPKLAYEIPKDLSEKFVHSLMKRFNLVMEKCFDLVKEKFFGILIGLWRKDHSLVEVLIKYPHVLLKGVGACSQIPQIKKGVSEILGWATKSKSLEMKIETSILLFLNVSQFDFFCFHDFFANIVRIVIETFIEQSEKNQNSKNIASIHSILNQIYNLIQKESTILCSILPDFLDQVLDKVINTHEKRKNFIQICLEIMLKSSVVENHGKQREETKIQEERILSEFFGAISRIPEVVDIPAQISSFISQKYRIENQIAFLIEKNIEMKSKIENHHLISEIKIPFGIEDAKKEGRIGNFRELLRYYKKIGENEFIFGLCDGVIQESEKRKANYYQMIEKFDKSEKIVMRCLRKLSSTTNQNLAKKNENVETNYDLDEEQRFLEDEICRDLWVDASKNILSYESLLEFAKETFNFDLVLESLYRLGNFEAIQEVIKFHNFVPNNFQNHLIEFVSGLMIYANGNVGKYFDMENKDGKEQYFFTGEIQEKIRLGYHKLIYNVIQLFKNLFNSNQSRNLLPQIDSVLDVVQEVVEIGEFSDILLNFKSDNLEIISDDFRFFSQNLNAKIPNKTEKISFWNSLITTRMHMLSFFKGLERAETKKSMQKESGMNVDANLKTEKFRAILDEAVVENVLKLTNRYRINQMHNLLLLGYYPENENRNYSLIPNQGNSLMQMAQRSQFSTINTFHKLKIQLKSFDSLIRKTKQKLKRTPNKAYSYSQKPIPTKMNQLFKDVSHFFLVKPPTIQQVLVNTQQSEIGSLQAEIYSHLNEDLKASDIFLQGINQEKNINKNWERWGDFNQKLFRKSKEKTFLKRSLDCYIQAILLGGDQFGSLVSKVVYLANFCENFDLKESEQLSIWIPWIQQIIDSAYTLDYLENQNLNQEYFFEKILSAISKNSPQTLYYSLRSHAHPKSTESKKREVSMNIFLKILENINLDQDSKKQIEKIEEMLELIVDNFRPEIEEELVCELRKLLSDCWSFVFFHLDSPQTELSLFNNLISEIIQQIEDTYIAKIQQRNEERKQVLTSLDEESANILSRFSEIFRQYTISSFQKFRDDVLNKTLNCNSCFDTIKIIRQWIEEIEMWLEKKHLATNVNQISLESEEGWQSIAIPGQNLFFNLSSTKKTQSSERIKIFQIYSEMEKVDQYKNISRRFFFPRRRWV